MADITNNGGSPISSTSPKETSAPAATPAVDTVKSSVSGVQSVSDKTEETKTEGEILSVGRTSDPDKFIVRTEQPDGSYKQDIKSADEIRAAGGIVPQGDTQYVQKYEGSSLYGGEDKALSKVQQFAYDLQTEQGLSDAEARRITELAMREPDAPELTTVPDTVKERIVRDFGGSKFYAYQPQTAEGAPVGTMQIISRDAYDKLSRITDPEEYHDALISLRLIPSDTPYISQADYDRRTANIASGTAVLTQAGLIDSNGMISSAAFDMAATDARIRQALYDVGFSGKEVSDWKAGMPERYRQSLISWFSENLGMSKKAAEKTIADYKANPNDPQFAPLRADEIQALNMAAQVDSKTNLVVVGQDKSGNDLVMTTSQYAQQQDWERNVLPTLPDNIQRDYRAGNLQSVNDYIDQQVKDYVEQQAILATVQSIPGAYTPQEVMPEGVYGPPKPESYDWVAALMSGKVTADQLTKLGLDKSFVNATQSYATQVQGLIDKVNKGVKPIGKGLSAGIGLTGSEAIDLGAAIREAGLDIKDGSAVNTWRNLTDDQKYQVANVLAGYPSFGAFLPSTYRGLQSIQSDEKLGFVPKTALTVATAPFTAIITPFVKDMTVGELKQKVDKYATTGSDGKITDYNLTQYLKDNPYDAPLLARGGFSVDDIEKAQKGGKVNAMPEGATPLDWVIAGVMAASVALPVLKGSSVGLATRLVGGTGLTAANAPKAITMTMQVLRAINRGAAFGQEALKWGIPAGMTAYDIANWKNWTPEQRAVAGVFTGLTYIPILGSLYRLGAKGFTVAQTMTAKGGILPRGLTTGYQDVWAVRQPPDFFAGTNKGKLIEIYTSGKYSPTEQITAVANLMEPKTSAAFLSTVRMAQQLSQFKVPASMLQPLAPTIQKIGGFNDRTANALAKYFKANKGKVIIGGSAADDLQGMGAGAKDIDLYTIGLTPEQVKADIMNIITSNGDKFDPELWGDIHPHDSKSLGLMPYDFTKLTPKPITVGGASVISMGEQFLRRANSVVTPARGGMMGPAWDSYFGRRELAGISVSTHIGRAKDIFRLQFETQIAINIIKATDPVRAANLQSMLDKFSQYQKLTVEGRTTPIPEKEMQELEQLWLESVNEVQHATLVHGGNAVLLDPNTGTVVSKIVSPAVNEGILPGTIYFAARDLTAVINMLKTTGMWRPTGRQVFFSPEPAYDFLIDRKTGRLDPNAGIIALRTVPKVDMGRNGIIKGPFRYEYIDGKPVIYNELVSEGEFYATEPNARALSTDGVSGGSTGESVTYYPRRNAKVPILWTATKAARIENLGAPSPERVAEINRIALLDTLATYLGPLIGSPKSWHWAEVTTSEVPAHLKSGLIEFYRDTYRAKQLPPEKLAVLLRSRVKTAREDAIANLKSRGVETTADNILAEVINIYHAEATALAKLIYKSVGVTTTPKEIEDMIAAVLVKGNIAPVDEITDMLSSIDPATRANVVKDAEAEYDAEIGALQKLSPEASAAFSNSDKLKRYYYLNLGKLSTKLAALASTMSILTATAPAIANTLVPLSSTVTGELPITTPVPTTVGGITTPPTVPASTVPPTTIPRIPTPTTPTITPPTSVITPTVPPTIPTTPPTPSTEPTTPTTPPPPTTTTTPPPPTTTPPPPTTQKPPPPVVGRLGKGSEERQKIPAGSITFAWGKVNRGSGDNRRKVPVWRYIPPPWVQSKPETLYAPPIGAKNIDSTNPYTTVQMIGDAGAPVPERIAIDLGITDAFVSDGGQSISFGGGGEQTNVGATIPLNTQGMTIEGGGDGISRPEMTDYKPPSSVSRPAIAKTKKPVRGDTSVSGINRPKIADDTKAMLDGTYVEPSPVKPKPKDNLSDLTSFTEKDSEDILELSDKDMDDLFGTGGRKRTKKQVNRVNMRRTKPIRGRGATQTMVGRISS